MCDVYGKTVATCAAPKTGDKPISKTPKENNSEYAEDGEFDAVNASESVGDNLSETKEDESKLFAKPGVAQATSCNDFGVHCFGEN